MSNYITFMGKELTENLRTKRLLVLGCVFLFFAITGALLARYMGEFFAFIMPSYDETSQLLIEAMGNPSWQEAYVQFYSQIGQIGVIAILFMYMGTVQREIRTGTASLMFSKGLGFGSFILAKFTMAVIITTVITAVSALVTYVYTFLLFEEAGHIGNILTGSLVFSIGVLMMLSVIILGSSLTKSSAVSAGISTGIYFALILSTIIPHIGSFSPFNLLSHPIAITVTGTFPSELTVNILLAITIAVIALFFATQRLKKAEG
ncbi:MAG: ABC transporter permease [Firmicutes bacterium]|nr:ABC transporter permease [Bacillota bacterium]